MGCFRGESDNGPPEASHERETEWGGLSRGVCGLEDDGSMRAFHTVGDGRKHEMATRVSVGCTSCSFAFVVAAECIIGVTYCSQEATFGFTTGYRESPYSNNTIFGVPYTHVC